MSEIQLGWETKQDWDEWNKYSDGLGSFSGPDTVYTCKTCGFQFTVNEFGYSIPGVNDSSFVWGVMSKHAVDHYNAEQVRKKK